MSISELAGSASLHQSDYWWYRARAELLRVVLERFVGDPERILDVGSADGPSVGWLRGRHRVQLDVDPRGLSAGTGVRGSALALPFADQSFDVVGAFDVLEHCDPEPQALDEFTRVLRVGGMLLMSVPAYEWAWTEHDVRAGHFRRYTRSRLLDAVRDAGLSVHRCSYAFTTVFPFFAAERLVRRLRKAPPAGGQNYLPAVSSTTERMLMRMCAVDRWMLRGRDLPFGSSVVIAAEKRDR